MKNKDAAPVSQHEIFVNQFQLDPIEITCYFINHNNTFRSSIS